MTQQIAGALSMSQSNKCLECWCTKECDEVGGETLCGLMRMYYINRLSNGTL